MVSVVHRFLHGRTLHSSYLKQVWVFTGAGVTDGFYHDAYHGCVGLATTLQIWAHEVPSEVGTVTVVLTRDAQLDFSGNPDPEAAETLFDGATRRPPRYGRRGRPTDGAPTDDDTRAAADAAAERLSASLGGGQGLLNLLVRVRAAFERATCDMVVIVEDLYVMYRGLLAGGEVRVAHDVGVALQDLVNVAKAGRPGRMLVLFDPRDGLIEEGLIDPGEGVARTPVPPPGEREVAAALVRAARRNGVAVSHLDAVATVLAREGSLDWALSRAGRVHASGQALSLASVLDLPEPDEAEVARILAELDGLVGLDEPGGVKAQVRRVVELARGRMSQLRRTGVLPETSLHMVFVGNPGTGKTTVANVIARLFHALGLLPRPTVVEASVSQIVKAAVGGTREAMQATLEQARGGVLFLDEAHQLVGDNGKEAIDAIVPFSENHRDDTVVILAGYPDGMRKFMATDSGLPSRFATTVSFPDYVENDLWRMLESGLAREHWSVAPDAGVRLRQVLVARKRSGSFGNARGARNLRDEVIQNRLQRGGDDPVITLEDLPEVARPHPKELAEAEARLDQLVGLEGLRALLARLRDDAHYAIAHTEPLPPVPRLRFLGPPGTGKTTVAKILAQYLYGLGLLQSTEIVETTGVGLKAGYLGQTGGNVNELFAKARGGLLLIDEAYGVAPDGQGDSYSQEAVNTLVAECTRDENLGTVVVLAGYEDAMGVMMRANDGLARRFPERIHFPALTSPALAAVARGWAEHQGLQLTEGFEPLLEQAAERGRRARDFGNSGWAVQITERAASVMKGRVQRGGGPDRVVTADDLWTALAEQYPEMLPDADAPAAEPTAPRAPAAAALWRADGLLLPSPGSALATDAEAVRTLAASTFPVAVELADGQSAIGTGFLITPDGLTVTAAHVIEGARAVRARPIREADPIPAEVLVVDDETDVALLRVAGAAPAVVPLPLGRSDALQPLQRLVVAGYNHASDDEAAHTVATDVSRNDPQDPVHFETTGAVEFGSSGGPVLDPAQAAVVGLVHAGLGTTIKIMIRVEQVYDLLRRHGWVDGRRDPAAQPQEEGVAAW